MIWAAIETMDFQRIDRGLHRRVFSAQVDELRLALTLGVRLRAFTLLGQDHLIDNRFEFGLVPGAVKALVEADAGKLRSNNRGQTTVFLCYPFGQST